jgi:hypothetical protein
MRISAASISSRAVKLGRSGIRKWTALQRQLCPIGAAQEALDLVAEATVVSPAMAAPFAHREASVSALDQRRAAKQQALLGAGEAEIVVAGFAQTPDLMDH